ncbi:hypothetical protein, partial [Roseibium sp. RKSG952]|uniref:hypothetical protein n=1 Tax=Roseibium sp. RKSG952 TaxID=2529384 RepID=UPI0018AD1949
KFFDSICEHMESAYTESGCIYVWQVKHSERSDGTVLIKIGISCDTVRRVSATAKANSYEPMSVYSIHTGEETRSWEQWFLSLGGKCQQHLEWGLDGATEFRRVTSEEFDEILCYFEDHGTRHEEFDSDFQIDLNDGDDYNPIGFGM